TRRRHMTTAVDRGSIPRISTIGCCHTVTFAREAAQWAASLALLELNHFMVSWGDGRPDPSRIHPDQATGWLVPETHRCLRGSWTAGAVGYGYVAGAIGRVHRRLRFPVQPVVEIRLCGDHSRAGF